MTEANRKKICFVVAVPGSAHAFLRDHIAALSQRYDVYLAGNIANDKAVEGLALKGWQHIDIMRPIALGNDLKAVAQLASYFLKMRFDAVHSVTPKAGLVCALAGFAARIPHRIHIFTGQVWATSSGMKRTMLKAIDWLIAKLNTNILVDGKSQRDFLVEQGVVSDKKAKVLANGSICGVNASRFDPDARTRAAVRSELGIDLGTTVFVFMGRLNRDKGVNELLAAFNILASQRKDVYLLMFGSDEENMAQGFDNYPNLKRGVNFTYYGVTPEPYRMLQCADVFVLPTYREGFGSSVIEASCLGLPVITSDAYGVLDASVDGVTGLRCKVGDVATLYSAMSRMAGDKELRAALGSHGRERVLSDFSAEVVVKAWQKYYADLLEH